MATKSTHKKTNFDKQQVSKKLDTLAEKVSKLPIYVINKSDRYYQILNYYNKTVYLDDIPTKFIAERLCEKVNSKSLSNNWLKEVKELLDHYAKMDYDCIYYTYTIENTEDSVTRSVAQMRREATMDNLRHVIQKLKFV